ncbi:hypothetical protein GCM10011611_08700 [Aliidongia dinghuensis]|uniref:Tetratricopeptide repeat protein n=1 Tax=Aliidongia dinghuensis TaxID=1867774 RepID=A0A8J3E0W5_9PROT|nr:hypothetical protein GCM10011611_08700 [Aliidongia dinghuensis]
MFRHGTLCALALLGLQACSNGGSRAEAPTVASATADRGESLARMADDAAARGDMTTALAFYRQAALAASNGADGNAAGPMLMYGNALMAVGAYDQAGGAFRRVVEREPENAQALVGLGSADLALGKSTEAADLLQRVIARHPEDLRARRNLGVALDLAGRHAEAQAAYREGLGRSPDDEDLKADLALSLALAGDAGQSVALIREVAASPFAEPRHLRNAVLVLSLAGQDQEAQRLAERRLPADTARQLMARIQTLKTKETAQDRTAAIGFEVGG